MSWWAALPSSTADYSRTTGDIDLLVDPGHVHVRELDGVKIPFANPDLLWRMKSRSLRPKDQGDLYFLRELFAAEGRQPPE